MLLKMGNKSRIYYLNVLLLNPNTSGWNPINHAGLQDIEKRNWDPEKGGNAPGVDKAADFLKLYQVSV